MYTVTHLVRAFLKHLARRQETEGIENGTILWYRAPLNKLCKAHGDYPADELRAHKLTPKITNAFARVVKALYQWAADEDVCLVSRNWMKKMAIPPCGRRERELTKPELRRLYLVCARPLRRLLFVQLHTIARPGEVRNLVWRQIDWERSCIILEKFKGQKFRKVRVARRAIPLPPHVLRFLANMRRKAVDPSPDGRVFYCTRYYLRRAGLIRGGCDGPWTGNGVRCAMRRARVKAGLEDGGEHVVCYHLRHKGATEAVRHGMDLNELADIMGHTQISTTKRYTHLNTEDLRRSLGRVAQTRAAAREAGRPPKAG